ncbi:hypothetical protein O3M35_003310 [Rhynocoris fuscipes]|uniref:Phospholipase A2-like domain-containing protein n=1 Tax=Rhynocoris fuscipes TaxID=488301 RepID=A0AAW1CM10_9HEMI
MPVLPFHRYIGPGNPSDNGDPVDEDDRIAKVHDIKYDEAKTVEDVRKADVEAIIEFRKSWRKGNWHSLIGDAGLSIKYLIESYTGVLYPILSKQQIEHNCQILHIKNILRLHCVYKNKPFLEKYESNILVPSENLNYSNYDFVSQRKIIDNSVSPFIYVPLDWRELFIKYSNTPLIWNTCVFCNHNFCDTDNILNETKLILPVNYNLNKILKYNIFNLEFWWNIINNNSINNRKMNENKNSYIELYDLELFKLQN